MITVGLVLQHHPIFQHRTRTYMKFLIVRILQTTMKPQVSILHVQVQATRLAGVSSFLTDGYHYLLLVVLF
jgi:hypothetical protein